MRGIYKANKNGEVWLWIEDKKTILLEEFSSENDAVRCAVLLNDYIPASYNDGYDHGYDTGFSQGWKDGSEDASKHHYWKDGEHR